MAVNKRVLILRQAISKIVFMLAGKKIKVTQQGTKAYVEWDTRTHLPIRVNIPNLPDDASDLLIMAIQGFIDHEIGHVLYTTPAVVEKAMKLKIHGLHNVVEDTFIEKKMERLFNGSAYNLDATRTLFTTDILPDIIKKNPDDIVSILTMPMIRAFAGQSLFERFMEDKWHHVDYAVKTIGDDIPQMIRDCESSEDCLAVAILIRDRLKQEQEKRKKEY